MSISQEQKRWSIYVCECIHSEFVDTKGLANATFYFIYSLLKDNCFTEFCGFLSNLNMNQPQVYIYHLSFEPPSHLPPIQVDTKPLFGFPETYKKFLLAIYFTYGYVSFHVTLSIHLTLSSPSPCP